MWAKRKRRGDPGGQLLQVAVVPGRMRAAVHARGFFLLVPADAEAVTVRRRRALPRMQALIDQRTILDEQLLQTDQRARIGPANDTRLAPPDRNWRPRSAIVVAHSDGARSSEQRRDACEGRSLGRFFWPAFRSSGRRHRGRRLAEPLSNRAATLADRIRTSISKKRFKLQASRLHVPTKLPLRRKLCMQHRRVLENVDAGTQQLRMVELLCGRAGPVVRVGRNEEADAHAAPGGVLDSLNHPPVGDVRVDHVERLARVEQTRDLGGDRPVPAGSVVEDYRWNRVCARLEEGKRPSSSSLGTEPRASGSWRERRSCNCETTGPVARTNRSWKRPSWK